MSRFCQAIVCAALIGVPSGLWAGPAPDTPPPHEVVATFHDGTVIQKAALHGNLELITRYGKLTVPIRDVQRIEIGFRLSAEDTRTVEEAIHELGSKQFRQREAAERKLIALGFRAYPAVVKATQSKDAEVVRRAQAVLQKIQQTTPADKLQIKPHDTVVTADCVLTGRLVADVLKAKTAAFGKMQFKLLDLRAVHSASKPPSPAVTSTTVLYNVPGALPTPTPVAPAPAPILRR
jgi:hypothetical protein